MRSYTSSQTSASNLPLISDCWKVKNCDGAPQEVSLERVAPKAAPKAALVSKPLFGGNPFESFENAFQAISF